LGVVGDKTPTYPDESGRASSPKGGTLSPNFMNFINPPTGSLPRSTAGQGRLYKLYELYRIFSFLKKSKYFSLSSGYFAFK